MSEELIFFKKWKGEKIKKPQFQYENRDKPLVKFFNKDAENCCDGRVSTIKTIYDSEDNFIGYYAIAMSQIDSNTLFDKKRACRFPHPAIKLGRIFLDSRYRNHGEYDKKGYGIAIIKNIIHIAQELNKKFLACRFIIVDSKTNVIGFYERVGFQRIQEKNSKLKIWITKLLSKTKIKTNQTIPMLFDLKP